MKLCKTCGKENTRKRSDYCSIDCGTIGRNRQENRQKISDGRKKFLKENPDKHPWKRTCNTKSKPCENVKTYLTKNNIVFVEEWLPLQDRFFSIDIAFPDIKYGIEVNGNQHYNPDGTLKPYYKERHDLIVASGWKLLELHYSSCFNEDVLKSIINIGEQPDYSEFFRIQNEKKQKRVTEDRGVKQSRKYELKWEPYKEILLTSDIDFSKFGWVEKARKILGIPAQKVNKWMKRFLPDFYETHCFKRNIAPVA